VSPEQFLVQRPINRFGRADGHAIQHESAGSNFRGAHDGDKDLRRLGLACQPVNDHRHRVASVIDKQLIAAGMGLPHRDRDARGPDPVQLAEPRIPIPLGITLDVFVP